ncbi:MAG TPA: hypothetical protein VGM90_36725 [Kofleriaceae bacterium]
MSDSPLPDDEPVPKLPRGKGLVLNSGMMFRIAMTVALLIMIVISARPCANMTSKFVTDFGDGKGSANSAMPKPGNLDVPVEQPGIDTSKYVQLRPGMTDEEVKAAIEQAKQKNAARGSAAAPVASGAGSAK